MKTKIAVLALIAVTAGVFTYKQTKHIPPSDLRDAVADVSDSGTGIADVKKVNIDIPAPEAAVENDPAVSPMSAGRSASRCKLTSYPRKELAAIGDIRQFRVDSAGPSGMYYAEFDIDFNSEAWIGGLNSCGEGSANYSGAKTFFRVDRFERGRYTVYSARCGGMTNPYDGSAQVVFRKGSRKPVYIRAVLKAAKYSLSNGIHSGIIKDTLEDVTCSFVGFEPSTLPILGEFDRLHSLLNTGSRESTRLVDLYKEIRR